MAEYGIKFRLWDDVKASLKLVHRTFPVLPLTKTEP